MTAKRTMESDSAEIIKFCQKKKITNLKVKFDMEYGWSVDQKYCCSKHQPELILNSEGENLMTDNSECNCGYSNSLSATQCYACGSYLKFQNVFKEKRFH